MKKIMIVWAVVAIILVGVLTYIGFNIKDNNKPYKSLEKELERKASALIGEKPGLLNSLNKLTVEDFNNNGYPVEMTVNGDKCDGYVTLSKNISIYEYNAYIKCNNYTTNGYQN